jgi:hypothetical protein
VNFRFFHNTGAVAGTFSAVGVVVVILLVFIATRWVRQRRAKRLDAEIDEVAAAGANSGFAHDDYDYRSNATNFGGYSETSHGTLGQQPLAHADAYPTGDSYAAAGAGGGAGAAAAAGMAGIGRARSQRSTGDPFGAFAAPHDLPPLPSHAPENYELADANSLRYRRSAGAGAYQYDPIIGGYGAGDDPYAIARGPSQRRHGTPGSQEAGYGQSFYPPMPQAQHQPPLPPLPPPQQQQYTSYSARSGPAAGSDAYGGVEQEELSNPHSAGASKANLVDRQSDESARSAGHPAYAIGSHEDHDHEPELGEQSEDDEPEADHNPRVLRVRLFRFLGHGPPLTFCSVPQVANE